MKITKKILLLILLLVLWLPNLFIAKQADEYVINSPDSLVEISYYLEKGRLHYKLLWEKQVVINSSDISLIPDTEVRILNVQLNSQDTIWNPVWGQFSEIRDHYNELILDIEIEDIKGEFIARVFDNGLGFRFKMDNLIEHQEVKLYVEYNLSDNDRIFFPVGESEPIGPIAVNEFISDPNKLFKIRIPLVVEKTNGKYLSILESDLYSAIGSDVMELTLNQNKKRLVSSNDISKINGQLITPWRVILLGNSAGELVTNTVTVNLATPNQLENNDWVRPGKTLWDWRVHGFTAPDGFKYGINTESYKRFIDFAAKNDVEYFLIDDSWYEDVSKGYFEISEKFNLNEVSKYAAEKGVDIILYYDRKKGQYGDDELFPYYKSLGMKGIKYGFMGGDVDFSREAIKKSAENKLLINFHDSPVPFTGMRRTYPNAVTREYCHAQQDSRRAFTPEAFIKMALVNAIQGPLDMNNGNFDLININNGFREKGPRKKHTYFSTVVSEAARTLIIFSGLVCLPDAPEAYEAKIDLFEFIQKQHAGKWEEAVQAYLASISFADAQVGRLLDALEKTEKSENTIIVFWSDHGWHLGEKETWHKGTLWQRATRVPFIILDPRRESKGVCKTPVNLIDIYKTLNELCGLPELKYIDGQSLVPQLQNVNEEGTYPSLISFQEGNFALQGNGFHYIRYKDGTEELYNHSSDINEWYNLADSNNVEVLSNFRESIPKDINKGILGKNAFQFDYNQYAWKRSEY